TNRYQYPRSQSDDDPSLAHGFTVSKAPQSRNLFGQAATDSHTIPIESLVSGDAVSKFTVMKRPVVIALVVVLIGILAIVFVHPREPVSLTFVQYLPWRQAAKLKLTNNSSKTITYLTDQNGGAVLSLLKTSTGWTNSLPEIRSGTMTVAATGKTTPA